LHPQRAGGVAVDDQLGVRTVHHHLWIDQHGGGQVAGTRVVEAEAGGHRVHAVGDDHVHERQRPADDDRLLRRVHPYQHPHLDVDEGGPALRRDRGQPQHVRLRCLVGRQRGLEHRLAARGGGEPAGEPTLRVRHRVVGGRHRHAAAGRHGHLGRVEGHGVGDRRAVPAAYGGRQVDRDRGVAVVGQGDLPGDRLLPRVRDLPEVEQRRFDQQPLVQRGRDVQPAGALLVGGQGRVRPGGAGQRGLQLGGRPVRVPLGQIAAAPATCGVAIEVPCIPMYEPLPEPVPAAWAAVIGAPGAVRSGFSAWEPNTGPREEKLASWSKASTAPTVRAAAATPGEPMVRAPSAPSLPAAITNRVPWSRVRSFTAWLIGSVPSVGAPPRLMFTTAAPSATAHSMPSMIHEVWPVPSLLSTLPDSSRAPGATPVYRPPEAAPVPSTVEATWVPYPWPSTGDSPGTKLTAWSICPARSGWVASTPVSSTATLTPEPSKPCAQASGAPTWGTLTSRVALTGASSHTFSIVDAAAAVAARAPAAPDGCPSCCQRSGNSSGVNEVATALMLSSTSPPVGSGTAAVVAARAALRPEGSAYCRMTGRCSV